MRLLLRHQSCLSPNLPKNGGNSDAQALAAQTKDTDLKKAFTPLAEKLTSAEKQIVQERISVQGKPADIGGYYQPDNAKASVALRPSQTFNAILAQL